MENVNSNLVALCDCEENTNLLVKSISKSLLNLLHSQITVCLSTLTSIQDGAIHDTIFSLFNKLVNLHKLPLFKEIVSHDDDIVKQVR